MDIFQAVYFKSLEHFSIIFFIFVLSGKTESGPAGEQPVRDKPGDRRKCHQ
jgi:hypothetical protein